MPLSFAISKWNNQDSEQLRTFVVTDVNIGFHNDGKILTLYEITNVVRWPRYTQCCGTFLIHVTCSHLAGRINTLPLLCPLGALHKLQQHAQGVSFNLFAYALSFTERQSLLAGSRVQATSIYICTQYLTKYPSFGHGRRDPC